MKLAAKIAGVVYRWERTEIAVHLSRDLWNSKAIASKQNQARCSLIYSPCFAGEYTQSFGLVNRYKGIGNV